MVDALPSFRLVAAVVVVPVLMMMGLARVMCVVAVVVRRDEEQIRKQLPAVRCHVRPRRHSHAPQRPLHREVQMRRRHAALLE